MGLTTAGFVPESYENISQRIKDRIDAINPGFDFSLESPDGLLVDIFSQALTEAWNQLDLVYLSYHPNYATGEALRNIGLLSGYPFKKNTRSVCRIDLTGTAGTIIPQYTEFVDAAGGYYYSILTAIVPSSVDVLSDVLGPVPVPAGTIIGPTVAIPGLDAVDQPDDGREGELERSEAWYRNIRQRIVMRNSAGQDEGMEARLLDLGLEQATVINNDGTAPLPDGTPAGTIHVKVGEFEAITDAAIGKVILNTKPLGCPTFGATTVSVNDAQGNPHDINFTKATEVFIFIALTVTYLDEDVGGVTEKIKFELSNVISSMAAGEDVVWSRLFEYITPYGKAQVDELLIGTTAGNVAAANIPISDIEYPTCQIADIIVTVN